MKHHEHCMCERCCFAAAASAARSATDDPERQYRLVEAYCRGRLDADLRKEAT